MDARPIELDPSPCGAPLARTGSPGRAVRDDVSPEHELAVERFAAQWVGLLGPQTLHSIMIHAGRVESRRGSSADAVAVAVYHLWDLSRVPVAELTRVFGMSKTWGDERMRLGRQLAGGPRVGRGRPRVLQASRPAMTMGAFR